MTYDVEVTVMVERTVWFSVECDSEHEDETYEMDNLIEELAENKYFGTPYNQFDFNEETAELNVNNYQRQ
jgi:hypothetical protein